MMTVHRRRWTGAGRMLLIIGGRAWRISPVFVLVFIVLLTPIRSDGVDDNVLSTKRIENHLQTVIVERFGHVAEQKNSFRRKTAFSTEFFQMKRR